MPTRRTSQRKKATFAVATAALLLVGGALAFVYLNKEDVGEGIRSFSGGPKAFLSDAKDVVRNVVGAEGKQISITDATNPLLGLGVDVPPGALRDASRELGIGNTQDDEQMPAESNSVAPQVHLLMEGLQEFDVPLTIKMPFAGSIDLKKVIPLAYDEATQTWDAAPTRPSPSPNTILVDTVRPQPLAFVESTRTSLPEFTTEFQPDADGWSIGNEGGYLTLGGNAFGMASYAKWYFQRQLDQPYMNEAYSDDAQRLLASRMQLYVSDQWQDLQFERRDLDNDPATGARLANLLAMTVYPQILLMGPNGSPEHAVLVTGYGAGAFEIYDPDHSGETRTIGYSESGGFDSYEGHDTFGIYGLNVLASDATLQSFHDSARDETLSVDDLQITSPVDGDEVTSGLLSVSGTLSGRLADATVVVVYVGVDRFTITPSFGGTFSAQVPVNQAGDVEIYVLAGGDDPERSADAVARTVRVHNAQGDGTVVTLTWNQASTDVDLHVVEPDGERVYFGHKDGGGDLDVDDVDGFGPEHYTLRKADVEIGNYNVFVKYYGQGTGGTAPTISGNVQVLIQNTGQRPIVTNTPFSLSQVGQEVAITTFYYYQQQGPGPISNMSVAPPAHAGDAFSPAGGHGPPVVAAIALGERPVETWKP